MGGYCPARWEEDPEMVGLGMESFREVETNPNFFLDAARIYISQKTEVDKNFGIGNEFGSSRGIERSHGGSSLDSWNEKMKKKGMYGMKSAIALKADNIRIIGRESIRIVTGTDKFNSVGGEVGGKHGIELVAMNETNKLQPMVLGDNLLEFLRKLVKQIDDIQAEFNAQTKYQTKMNDALGMHDHHSPFFAYKTLMSMAAAKGSLQCGMETVLNTEFSCMAGSANAAGLEGNYLSPTGGSKKFILSGYNKNN